MRIDFRKVEFTGILIELYLINKPRFICHQCFCELIFLA